MRRVIAILATWLSLVASAHAHVGSPDVFFEGAAGPYSVYLVIRPPAALPGAAQVSVRSEDGSARSVSLLPVMYQAGRQGSPAPVAAQAVPGEPNLWSAEVWFLRPGSYTVQVRLDGARGLGEVTIPLNTLGLANPAMKPGRQIALLGLGMLLLVGAVFIVRGIAREGCLPEHEAVLPGDSARGARAGAVAAVLLAAAVTAGAMRWHNMDSAYRINGVAKPRRVSATVRAEANRVLVEIRAGEEPGAQPSWDALVPEHGKLMHLFLIREPQWDVFAHLHPVRLDAASFGLEAPALPAGDYQLYGEITYQNGMNQTLAARVLLPQPAGGTLAFPPAVTNLAGDPLCGVPAVATATPGEIDRDRDDSWHVGPVSAAAASTRMQFARLMGGYSLVFENAEAAGAGRDGSLRFAAFGPDGRPAALQSYMGMLGHAAVRRFDSSVFAHLHPLGSFSMASQEVFQERDPEAGAAPRARAGSVAESPPNRVGFPYQFPRAGKYRLWVQVRIAGRVLTGVYDLEVTAGA